MSTESGDIVVERFWHAFARRDFDAAAACLAADFIQRWPQSGERIVGPADWKSMASHHPAFPESRLERVHGSGPLWVAELVFDYDDGSPPYQVAAIQQLAAG